jgi:Arc/MetJ family transcription regulator
VAGGLDLGGDALGDALRRAVAADIGDEHGLRHEDLREP